VDLIERTLRAMPFCPACGQHTEVVEIGQELVLRCSTIGGPRTGIERFLGFVGRDHVSRPLIEVRSALAA
jgi:hypothetical protein